MARRSGYVGMITANSFMKREFGKKLIEEFFPKIDLTHVIDTSGAYIPGHGTPTVILFGRSRSPLVRRSSGAGYQGRAEHARRRFARAGLAIDRSTRLTETGADDEFTSTADVLRSTFASHPWSIGGGGAADLKRLIEENASVISWRIVVDSIGDLSRSRRGRHVRAPATAVRRTSRLSLISLPFGR